MPVLSINNLSKSYGKLLALDNLTLDINAGEVYGILGPNGSGKTTTLGIILGILKSSSGSFKWFDGEHYPYHRRRIGAILETPNFFPYLNAADNLDIVAKIKNVSSYDVDGLLRMVNLYDRKRTNFRTYSLGMKQRLAIAATLIGDPDVVIFDEPTNGLDPEGIAEVRSILKNIADSGRTVIMASHLLDEVEKICSHVAILRFGKVLSTGPVGSILTNYGVMDIQSENLTRLREVLESLPWIHTIIEKNGLLECEVDQERTGAEMNALAFSKGITLTHLVTRKKRLEEEFLELTNNLK